MALLDLQGAGRFLFDVLPSEFPGGQLTETEVLLWELYYKEKAERLKARK